MRLHCDRQQISRVLTNLLLNAAEAINGREEPSVPPGRIEVALRLEEDEVRLEIADNGRGLPDAERHRLTEPYVTTRAGGTGLGLAIVIKILEDHKARLDLSDRPGGGAVARVTFDRDSLLASTRGSPDVSPDSQAPAEGAAGEMRRHG